MYYHDLSLLFTTLTSVNRPSLTPISVHNQSPDPAKVICLKEDTSTTTNKIEIPKGDKGELDVNPSHLLETERALRTLVLRRAKRKGKEREK